MRKGRERHTHTHTQRGRENCSCLMSNKLQPPGLFNIIVASLFCSHAWKTETSLNDEATIATTVVCLIKKKKKKKKKKERTSIICA